MDPTDANDGAFEDHGRASSSRPSGQSRRPATAGAFQKPTELEEVLAQLERGEELRLPTTGRSDTVSYPEGADTIWWYRPKQMGSSTGYGQHLISESKLEPTVFPDLQAGKTWDVTAHVFEPASPGVGAGASSSAQAADAGGPEMQQDPLWVAAHEVPGRWKRLCPPLHVKLSAHPAGPCKGGRDIRLNPVRELRPLREPTPYQLLRARLITTTPDPASEPTGDLLVHALRAELPEAPDSGSEAPLDDTVDDDQAKGRRASTKRAANDETPKQHQLKRTRASDAGPSGGNRRRSSGGGGRRGSSGGGAGGRGAGDGGGRGPEGALESGGDPDTEGGADDQAPPPLPPPAVAPPAGGLAVEAPPPRPPAAQGGLAALLPPLPHGSFDEACDGLSTLLYDKPQVQVPAGTAPIIMEFMSAAGPREPELQELLLEMYSMLAWAARQEDPQHLLQVLGDVGEQCRSKLAAMDQPLAPPAQVHLANLLPSLQQGGVAVVRSNLLGLLCSSHPQVRVQAATRRPLMDFMGAAAPGWPLLQELLLDFHAMLAQAARQESPEHLLQVLGDVGEQCRSWVAAIGQPQQAPGQVQLAALLPSLQQEDVAGARRNLLGLLCSCHPQVQVPAGSAPIIMDLMGAAGPGQPQLQKLLLSAYSMLARAATQEDPQHLQLTLRLAAKRIRAEMPAGAQQAAL